MNLEKVTFQNFKDDQGSLVVLETQKQVPFEMKRLYYILGVPQDQRRGFHAHKQLIEMAFVVKGSCKILMDDGTRKQDVALDSSTEGLLIEPMVWHEMYDFSDDCVLVVLASELYNEDDYIRDYKQFKNMTEV